MFGKVIAFVAALAACLALGSATTIAGGGCHVPAGTTEGAGESVSMKDCAFGPNILRAPVGATVTWTNRDAVPHAVNGLGWDATMPYGQTKPSENVSHTFAARGVYPYMCYIHPGMAGVVVVGDAVLGAAAPPPADTAARSAFASGTAPAVGLPLAALLVVAAALLGYVAGARSGVLAAVARRMERRYRSGDGTAAL